ncbi:MAG: AtpZ/AtpI family protein [Chloroflexi bacterium]|nr:AtpZ/AtpI family protein [Chloroflexota bacterium]
MGKRWAGAIRLIGIGWYIAACILLGALGGRWIGQKLDGRSSETILTIVGLFLGLIVAFLGVYRMVKSALTNNNDKGNG